MKKQKSLHEMSPGELGLLFPIKISEYSSKWPVLFENEKQLLIDHFNKDDFIRIEHIGSTAIPGIKAKPTIDILIVVPETYPDNTIIEKIKSAGYHYIPQPDNPPPHMFFVKGYTPKGFEGQAYHIHIRHSGHTNEIIFRDYLRKHHETAKKYEILKIILSEKYKYDRDAYTEAKTDFVKNILEKA